MIWESNYEKINNSPDWATHYIIDGGGEVIYESAEWCWWVGTVEDYV